MAPLSYGIKAHITCINLKRGDQVSLPPLCRYNCHFAPCLVLQFDQNKDLRKKLFETVGTILAEASQDPLLGIGFGQNNPKAGDPTRWNGKNLLGYALMEVRDELMKKYKLASDFHGQANDGGEPMDEP